MIKKESRNEMRKARHARVREKVVGTTECPRLNGLDQIKIFLRKS